MSEAVPAAAEEGVQTPDVQMEESEQKTEDKTTSLEDMFDDDDEDDDDEFASSAPVKQEDSSQECVTTYLPLMPMLTKMLDKHFPRQAANHPTQRFFEPSTNASFHSATSSNG